MNGKYYYKNKHDYKPNRKTKRRTKLKYASVSFHSEKKWIPTIVISCCLIIILTICTTLLVTGVVNNNKSVNTNPSQTATVKGVNKIKTENKVYPKYTANSSTQKFPKSNPAKYAVIINKEDNTIVAQRNAHKRTYPASTTKIMTLLIAAENMKSENDTFKMTFDITNRAYIAQASVAGFKSDEKITVKDLMYGTILPSGADAAEGLAIKIAGSEAKFVKLMNDKVKEMGLKNTHFNNVTGLHHKDNYSSAYDMAVILDTAMQNKLCKEILSTYQYTTEKTPQHKKGILLTSTLFKYMYGTEPETATITGGKTGYVDEAGYCIASFGEANETKNQYIIVTFKNPSLWPAFNGQISLYKKFAK